MEWVKAVKEGMEGQRRGREKITREDTRYTRSYMHRVIIRLKLNLVHQLLKGNLIIRINCWVAKYCRNEM